MKEIAKDTDTDSYGKLVIVEVHTKGMYGELRQQVIGFVSRSLSRSKFISCIREAAFVRWCTKTRFFKNNYGHRFWRTVNEIGTPGDCLRLMFFGRVRRTGNGADALLKNGHGRNYCLLFPYPRLCPAQVVSALSAIPPITVEIRHGNVLPSDRKNFI